MKVFDADKTRMIGLPCGEKNNCDNRPNVQPFSSNRLPEHHGRTDGRTDRIAISISRVSVLMRAKNSTLTVICPRGRARGSRFFFGRLSLYLISLARWRLLFATLVHDVNTFHSCSLEGSTITNYVNIYTTGR